MSVYCNLTEQTNGLAGPRIHRHPSEKSQRMVRTIGNGRWKILLNPEDSGVNCNTWSSGKGTPAQIAWLGKHRKKSKTAPCWYNNFTLTILYYLGSHRPQEGMPRKKRDGYYMQREIIWEVDIPIAQWVAVVIHKEVLIVLTLVSSFIINKEFSLFHSK